MLELALGLTLAMAVLFPDLPLSQAFVQASSRLVAKLMAKVGLGRALIAVGLALMLFAAIWALQGDAPLFLAMILPELAAWLTTFEIATLAEALVSVGTALVALRASGLGNYLKGRTRKRRVRRSSSAVRKSANDDDHAAFTIAA